MAYVIVEPCINVKDKACVEVCPVDCIYEGPRRTSLSPGSGRVPGDPYTAKSSTPAWTTSSGSGPLGRVSHHGRPLSGSVFLRISSAVTVVIRSR